MLTFLINFSNPPSILAHFYANENTKKIPLPLQFFSQCLDNEQEIFWYGLSEIAIPPCWYAWLCMSPCSVMLTFNFVPPSLQQLYCTSISSFSLVVAVLQSCNYLFSSAPYTSVSIYTCPSAPLDQVLGLHRYLSPFILHTCTVLSTTLQLYTACLL